MRTNLSRFNLIILVTVAMSMFLSACTASQNPEPAAPPPSSASTEPLLVAAAVNVQIAFTELGQKFTEQSGQPVEFSFGSSGNLTTQIENGAPFDVFVAANVAYVDRLNEQSLIFPETQHLYAQGRIVLAVNKDSGVQATRLEDVLNPNITWVAIANPEVAPYGQAAKEAMQSAGLWEAVQPKLVLAENIGQTLQFVQTGDAPVGIVALSIAETPEITYTLLPADMHQPLNQAVAVVKSTRHEAAARAFVDFVLSAEGQAILEKYGFQSPGQS
jgi:molybdate transport system substrate-binding protein